jgi:hypothetical protein
VEVERFGEFGRDAVGLRRSEHDRALVRRQRPGVAVDRRNRLAQHLVEHAAPPAQAADDVRDRGEQHAPRTDLIDH